MSALRSRVISTVLQPWGAAYSAGAPRHLLSLVAGMSGARSTGVSTADHLALYRHVMCRRPQYVLELGAGQSSAVIALARQDAGIHEGRFVAVEESPEWLAHHRETIPASLLPSIDLIQRDVSARDVTGRRAAFYRDLPVLPYEFVHIDGPEMASRGARVSCDVLDMLPSLASRCLIVFDGREDTARFAWPHLESAGFKMRRHPFTLSHEFVRG